MGFSAVFHAYCHWYASETAAARQLPSKYITSLLHEFQHQNSPDVDPRLSAVSSAWTPSRNGRMVGELSTVEIEASPADWPAASPKNRGQKIADAFGGVLGVRNRTRPARGAGRRRLVCKIANQKCTAAAPRWGLRPRCASSRDSGCRHFMELSVLARFLK